jgi:hypothetical protein
MKPTIERAVLRTALERHAPPGTILATFLIDMPESNGKLHFAITREHRFYQLSAVILPHRVGWLYQKVDLPRGDIALPDFVFYFIRTNVRLLGVAHLVGIVPLSKVPAGTPLTPDARPKYPN